MKTFDEFIQRFESFDKLAQLLKCHPFTIRQWGKFGIPEKKWQFFCDNHAISPTELYEINKKIRRDQARKIRES